MIQRIIYVTSDTKNYVCHKWYKELCMSQVVQRIMYVTSDKKNYVCHKWYKELCMSQVIQRIMYVTSDTKNYVRHKWYKELCMSQVIQRIMYVTSGTKHNKTCHKWYKGWHTYIHNKDTNATTPIRIRFHKQRGWNKSENTRNTPIIEDAFWRLSVRERCLEDDTRCMFTSQW